MSWIESMRSTYIAQQKEKSECRLTDAQQTLFDSVFDTEHKKLFVGHIMKHCGYDCVHQGNLSSLIRVWNKNTRFIRKREKYLLLSWFHLHESKLKEEAIRLFRQKHTMIEKEDPYKYFLYDVSSNYSAVEFWYVQQFIYNDPEFMAVYHAQMGRTLFQADPEITISQNTYCEIGKQIKQSRNNGESKLNDTHTFMYIRFYEWCCVDIDDPDIDIVGVKSRVEKICTTFPQFAFHIWKTTRGYHVHCMSHRIRHNSDSLLTLSRLLKGDMWYYHFAHKYGYKLRLSPKQPIPGDDDSSKVPVAEYYCEVKGDDAQIDSYCMACESMYREAIQLYA